MPWGLWCRYQFLYFEKDLSTLSSVEESVSVDGISEECTAYEGIISESTFKIANSLLLRDVKNSNNQPNEFAGLLFCNDDIGRKFRLRRACTLFWLKIGRAHV